MSRLRAQAVRKIATSSVSNVNYEFYSNRLRSKPDGDYIDNIHKNWFGNYRKLEAHHGYIQWIFPTTEGSPINPYCLALNETERRLMQSDSRIQCRLLKSYIMMLDFWGMQLNLVTGHVLRTKDYLTRYRNWEGSHNLLRITRCIRSLQELGLGPYALPFVERLAAEVRSGAVKGCSDSLIKFWIPTLQKPEWRASVHSMLDEWSGTKSIKLPDREGSDIRPYWLNKHFTDARVFYSSVIDQCIDTAARPSGSDRCVATSESVASENKSTA